MTQLTNERGFLIPEAELLCATFRAEVKSILATPTDEIHLRTLGCALKAMVSDEISAAMLKVRSAK